MSICQTVVLINCQLIVYWTKFQIQFTSGRIQQDSSRVKSDCLSQTGGVESHMETLAYVREKGGKKILKLRRLKKKADYVWATEGFPPPHRTEFYWQRGGNQEKGIYSCCWERYSGAQKERLQHCAIRLDKRGGGFHRAKNRTADMITKLMSNEHMKRMLSASEH